MHSGSHGCWSLALLSGRVGMGDVGVGVRGLKAVLWSRSRPDTERRTCTTCDYPHSSMPHTHSRAAGEEMELIQITKICVGDEI